MAIRALKPLLLLFLLLTACASPQATGTIAFSSDRDGDHEIRVMNDDGSGLAQLTDNGVDDVNPFWSPDGRYLAFTHDDPDNADTYITSPERPLLFSLTDHPADDSRGSWDQ